MFDSAITNSILQTLNNAYPRAVQDKDLFARALRNVAQEDKLNARGGTYMRQLCKAGYAKQLVRGYYTAIPQMKRAA